MARPDPQQLHGRPPPTSAWLHAALVLALLLAQALGLLHRTAHGPQLTHTSHPGAVHAADERAAPARAARIDADHTHAGETHAAASPFGHAAGQDDACRLFDQLALADLLADASHALPVFDAPCRAIEATGTAGALAVATAYQARAPPALG